MVATLFGELTADGQDIILVGEGDDWEMDQLQARLKLLTMNVTPVDADGNPVREGDWQRYTDALRVPATWATVVELGWSLNGFPGFAWVPQGRLNEWSADETIRRTSPVPPLPEDLLPPWVKRTPRSYQAEGAALIAAEGSLLLLDDPGTGKSATTLLGLEARRQAGTGIFPMVIVVPSWEVGRAWADEIAIWELPWPAPIMHKGPDRLQGRDMRSFRQLSETSGGILITTYATLRNDAADSRGPLVKLAPVTVIADEIHLAKNGEAKQTRALGRIARPARNKVGLSGTAIKHDTGDVHPMADAIMPRAFPDRKRFVSRFCARIEDDYGERIVGLNPAAEEEFFAIWDRQLRRVSKADVLPELPPKVYSERRPDIPPEWVTAYDTMEQDMLARLPDGSELPAMTTLLKFMRLSQLASCAADVDVTTEWDELLQMEVPKYNVTLKYPSWKAESLMEIAAERQGAPIVCFTASRQLAMITGRQYCEPAGLRTGYITGVGDGITWTTRQRDLDAFQAGKLDMMICTAKAGGTGITLTRSDTAVFLQRDLELDNGVQPEDRLQRIGSRHASIDIIDVIARGTVEDRVRQRLREKMGMLAQLVRDRRLVTELLGGVR